MKSRYSLLGVAAVVATLAGAARAAEPDAAPAPAPDPAALVQRVSAAYALEMRGVVGLRTQTELTIDGPMFHKRTPSSPWYVYADGDLVRSSEAPDARRPLVRDALRPENLSEYAFTFDECSGCAASEVEVAYTSARHDAYHAHGYFIIDTASERVDRSVEIPYQLPWPTRDGRIEVTWGNANATEWLPLTIADTFVGKLGPFSGTAHYVQRLSPYERFPGVNSAVDTLTAQTGATPAPAAPDSPGPAEHPAR
jgi:hypothetical protein